MTNNAVNCPECLAIDVKHFFSRMLPFESVSPDKWQVKAHYLWKTLRFTRHLLFGFTNPEAGRSSSVPMFFYVNSGNVQSMALPGLQSIFLVANSSS